MIEESARRWVDLDAGRWLGFLTLTARHDRSDSLRDLYGGVADAWRRFREDKWWRSLGWRGFWRATEVTYNERGAGTRYDGGWHPHLHLLLFAEGDLGVSDWGSLSDGVAERWGRAVVGAGLRPTDERFGSRLQTVSSGGVGLGEYLSKVLDGEGDSWSVGAELARSDAKRGGSGFSAMEVLDRATCGETWAIRRWREYEQVTLGRRAIESSRGLRELVGVEDVADEDLVVEDEGGEAVLVLHRSDYRRLALAGYAARVLGVCEGEDAATTVSFVQALLRLVGE
jgi:Replication protein